MFSRFAFAARLVQLAVVLPLLALCLYPVFAQGPGDGEAALDTKYRANRDLINRLFKGEALADPKDKQHAQAVDIAAKYVTYPFLWGPYQTTPNKISGVFEDHEKRLGEIVRGGPNTRSLAPLYTKLVIE